MKNSFIYTSFFIKVLWRNRKAATLLWLAPICFLFGIGIVVSSVVLDEKRLQAFQIAIINEDPTVETNLVIKQITESEHLSKMMQTIEVDRYKADEMLQNNEIAAVIHIPEGFSRDVARGKNTPVKVMGNNQRPLQAALVRHVMESAANFTSAAQSGINTVHYYMKELDIDKQERKAAISREVVSFSLHVLGRGVIYEENLMSSIFQTSLIQYYSFSFLVLLMMIWSFLGLLFLKGKVNQGIHQRLRGLGYSNVHGTVATMLATFFLVACSIWIITIFLFLYLKIDSFFSFLQVMAVSLVYICVFLCFFLLLQAIVKNVKLYIFVGVLVILFSTILGGHIVPSYYFPEAIQLISAFTINSWFLSILFSIIQEEVHTTTALLLFLFFLLAILLLFITLVMQRKEEW